MYSNRDSFILRSTAKISTILKTDLSKYTHCVVKTVSIPKTYYVLPDNGDLILNEGMSDLTVTFKRGNYNVNSFRLLLQTKLNAAGVFTYSVSFPNNRVDVDSGHYTIKAIDTGGVPFTIKTSNIYLAQMIGIFPDIVYTSTLDSFESVAVVNFQSYDEILIRSNIVTSQDQILQEVYSSGQLYNTSIEWNSHDVLLDMKKIKHLGINQPLEFFLTDSNGNDVNLNGNYWSMAIMFFKENNIIEAFKRYMKLKIKSGISGKP